MDGSIFRAHPCPTCWRITWQPVGEDCLLCQKGAVTGA